MAQETPPTDADRRRPPTAAEARALGHPMRLKILFACRERALSNKELAARLGTTPGTVHYHLRRLVEHGFLRPEQPRRGRRGSTEQPYGSTGLSWRLDIDPAGARTLRQVGADELLAARDADVVTLTRLGMTLSAADRDELVRRLNALAEEFAARSTTAVDGPTGPTPDEAEAEAEAVTLLIAVHRGGPASMPDS